MIKDKNIIINICVVVLSTTLYVLFCLAEHFNYHGLNDNPSSSNNAPLIISLIIGGLYFVGYFVNIFITKKRNIYTAMNTFSFGTAFFFCFGTLIAITSTDQRWNFDTSNISLFVSSAFTLLGFGLAIAAIMWPALVKRIKNSFTNGKIDSFLFYIVITYFLLFSMGLISSISALLNIQYAGTTFYTATIFRSILYSSAQIIAVVVLFFTYFVAQLIENAK